MTLPLFAIGMILITTIMINFYIIAVVVKANFKKTLNQLMAALLIAMLCWAFFILFAVWMPVLTGQWVYTANDLGYWSVKFVVISALAIFSTSFWFVEYFIRGEIKRDARFYSIVFFQFIVASSCFLDDIYFTKVTVMPEGYTILERQPFNAVISIFIFLHVFFSMGRLWLSIKNETDGVKKSQGKIILAALLFSFIAGIIADWILPVYFKISNLNALGPTFTLALVWGIVYSIKKYRFLDIRSAIQRSIAYAFSLGAIIGSYLLVLFIVSEIFNRRGNSVIIVSAGLTTLIGIYGSRPIEKYFSKLTDKIFFKDKYDYSKAVRELSEIMNINLDLKSLLIKLINKLEQIFKTNKVVIVIKNEGLMCDGEKLEPCISKDCPKNILDKLKHYHEILLFSEIPFIIDNRITNNNDIKEALKKLMQYGRENNFEAYAPILLKGKAIGMVFVGEKLSGDPYNQEDLNLLGTFSYQAAIALEKSRLYEAEKKYAEELEEKVKARTAKIEKLQQEQKQMMIDISHGLQTPLAIVKGESEFLQEELPDNKHVKVFEKSIDQVSKFIYDMLNLARLETTDGDFRKEKVDLSELMEELVEYFDVLVKENNIKIEKDIDQGVFVMGTRDKLEEMVNNLVSNSIKYIDNERVIKITLKQYKNKARLIVEDTGMGINAMFIPNLFSRFYRVKDEKHSGIKGTGIGLSIVKQIAEKHGGTIRAESMEGKWTRMIVELKTV